MSQLKIEPTLLFANPIEGGFTWTLASRFGEMLHMAEQMFGPRDMSYTILGIEFVAETPRIWYPGNRKHIVVQLNSLAASDFFQACYQLSHETIHLLSPLGASNANNFEEGLATHFSWHYMKTSFNQTQWYPTLPSYQRVVSLVTPLVLERPDAIRRLRESNPTISAIPADDLCRAFGGLSPENAHFLVQRFKRETAQ